MPDRLVDIPDVGVIAFPDTMSESAVNAAAAKLYAEKHPPPPSLLQRMTTGAVDALPAVGGALGGIVGGIGGTVLGTPVGGVAGAVGGATLGGAAGEAARQLVNRARGVDAPASPFAAAAEIGKQAGVQGASEVAGQGVMKGASMAAHGLMDFAIRPAPSVAEEFGDIAGTAIRERIPVGRLTPGSPRGSVLARTMRKESGANTTNLLTAAGNAGKRFTAAGIATGPVTEMAGTIAKQQPLSETELSSVSKMFAEYLDNHAGDLTPLAVKDLKTGAQGSAKPIFRARNAGNVVPAGESIKANFNEAVASGAKEALETIPKVAESEARTRGLIGVTKAVRRAETRRLPLAAELAAPIVGGIAGGASGSGLDGRATNAASGVSAAVLTRALLSPRTTSRAALGLTTPAIQQVLRQMPRAAVAALMEKLQKEDGE